MLDELKELIFGIAGEEAMPARVKQHIRRAQEDSEVLIGWVQLAGVGFLPWSTPSPPRPSMPM